MRLSIIVPAFNEAESLVELYSQISRIAAEQELGIEVIFVDDGSSDGSWKEIQEYAFVAILEKRRH